MTTVVQPKPGQYQQEGVLKTGETQCVLWGEGGKEGIMLAGTMEEMNLTRKDVKKII